MIKKLILSLCLVALAMSAKGQLNLTAPNFTKCIYSDRNVTIRETPSTSGRKIAWYCVPDTDDCYYKWYSASSKVAGETLNGCAAYLGEKDGWYKGSFPLSIEGNYIEGWASAKFCSLVDVQPFTTADFSKIQCLYRLKGKYQDYVIVLLCGDDPGTNDLYLGKIVSDKLVLVYAASCGDFVNSDKNENTITSEYNSTWISIGKSSAKWDNDGYYEFALSKLPEQDIDKIIKYLPKNPKKLVYFKANNKISSMLIEN